MKRVLEVCRKLDTQAVVAINKYDINEDNTVNKALTNGETIIEYPASKACREITRLWYGLADELRNKRLASPHMVGKGE